MENKTKTVNDRFADFATKCLIGIDAESNQYIEMKKAYFAGFADSIISGQETFTEETTEQQIINTMQGWLSEVGAFFLSLK